eukprot:scaffold3320_cov22-Prasinocladus_malaysianus.AAC.1
MNGQLQDDNDTRIVLSKFNRYKCNAVCTIEQQNENGVFTCGYFKGFCEDSVEWPPRHGGMYGLPDS